MKNKELYDGNYFPPEETESIVVRVPKAILQKKELSQKELDLLLFLIVDMVLRTKNAEKKT